MVHLFRKLGIEVGDYVRVVDILKLSAFYLENDDLLCIYGAKLEKLNEEEVVTKII